MFNFWTLRVLDRGALDKLAKEVYLPASAEVFWVDKQGICQHTQSSRDAEEFAWFFEAIISESFRWGEVYYRWASESLIAAALPLGLNQSLQGGAVVIMPVDEEQEELQLKKLSSAMGRFYQTLIHADLLNESLMRLRAEQAGRERQRAEAIHSMKQSDSVSLRSIYWKLEPDLFLAMRKGDTLESRRLLNQILMGFFSLDSDDLDRTKGFVLDLFTTMTRTLIEAGSNPLDMLGDQYYIVRELGYLNDEESLSHWVVTQLEKLIHEVPKVEINPNKMAVHLAMNYIREHCDEPLNRDLVAKKVGLSSAHFSRVIKQETGRSFSEHLTHVRIDKAVKMLGSPRHNILTVALECGFKDSSYFTKAFRRVMQCSPSEYRKKA